MIVGRQPSTDRSGAEAEAAPEEVEEIAGAAVGHGVADIVRHAVIGRELDILSSRRNGS